MSADQIAILRVIDAAANRAGEGLRVIEDYVRFVLDDRHLTSLCKSLRHDLTAALVAISSSDRHAARETTADVGTTIATPSEQHRADLRAVVAANFKRVEQSLRSLEEFAKALAGASPKDVPSECFADAPTRFEALRYRTYTLERAVDITRTSIDRLQACRLYVLVDGRESIADFTSLMRRLIASGVQAVQLRDKRLADRDLLARGNCLRGLTRDTNTLFIMNDRPDLARLVDADGVHVGQDELSVKDARRIIGPHPLVGVSTHSIEQARQAVLDGANYVGVGPTFASRTKQFEEFPGLDLLMAVAREISLPAFAIGGIEPGNLAAVLATGVNRVAISGAVVNSADPEGVVRSLLESLA